MLHSLFKSRLFSACFAGALLISTSACDNSASTPKKPVTQSTGKAAIGGAYTLVNHTGKTVTDADFKGRPQLIYFGFGYCPDVCPTALQQMGAAFDIVGKAADQFQPIFITVDPERDTPDRLAQFVTANGFPKGLTALTGTQDQIDHATKIFAVIANKVEDDTSAAGYTFDHTSIIYLMDKNGEFVDVFTHESTPADIAKGMRTHLKSTQ